MMAKEEVSCCALRENVNWILYQGTQVCSHLNTVPNSDCVTNCM
jgi:hypothetical protein